MSKARDLANAAWDKLDEDEANALEEKGFQLGKVVTIEGFASRIRKDSGELYANGKDDLAEYMRALADDLKHDAELLRTAYSSAYHADNPSAREE